MTQLVGIFGYPLAHSISPFVQQAAFDYYKLPVRYDAWPTPPNSLEEEVYKLRQTGYLGASVTIPHKEKIATFIDRVDDWAASIGAVNTIAKEGSDLVGYNTDTYGFIRSLKDLGGFDPLGKRVLVLGAGGAARAAVFGLAYEGIKSLVVSNRSIDRAQSLIENVRTSVEHVSVVPMNKEALGEVAPFTDLIVNSTSVGMLHGDAEDCTPLDANLISSEALVYDMVYNPPETPLLNEARKVGARTMSGLPMLIYQGAEAFRHWTGRKAPIDEMFRVGRMVLTRNSNVD